MFNGGVERMKWIDGQWPDFLVIMALVVGMMAAIIVSVVKASC